MARQTRIINGNINDNNNSIRSSTLLFFIVALIVIADTVFVLRSSLHFSKQGEGGEAGGGLEAITQSAKEELRRHFYTNSNQAKSIKSKQQQSSSSSVSSLPRILVIYFPQYHRDPLNDKNWGDNFTDWVSLQKSPKLNKFGYRIPRPTELGYYDLTNTNIRKQQGELAKQYGIDGFIYHHYWFYDPTHPGPNLARPLLNMLQDGQPNIPFFFNWCATKWINVWMGKAIFQTIPTNRNRAITLQEQYFDEVTNDQIYEHYQWLSQFFHHDNYIKINNQPVFLLYYFDERAIRILHKLREYAKLDGFDGLYLIVGRSAAPDYLYQARNLTTHLEQAMKKKTQKREFVQVDAFNQSMTYPYPLQYITHPFEIPKWCMTNNNEKVPNDFVQEITGVITTFDNTPRREYKDASIYNGGEPDNVIAKFETNLRAAIYFHTCCYSATAATSNKNDVNNKFVAINAWNEWAEGMSIEPSDVYGRRFLETIQLVKEQIISNNECKK